MAIKEQCESCRFDNGSECPGHSKAFDGTPCDQHVKEINLEKGDSQNRSNNSNQSYSDSNVTEYGTPNVDLTDQELDTPSDENIHGWLKFFLIFFVGIGSVASVIISLIFYEHDENFWFAYGDIIYAIVYLITGIFTIVSFHKRDTDAVFLGKTFVIFCFLTNLFVLITCEPEDFVGVRRISTLIRTLIWCTVWYIFLFKSSQVKRIIPPGYRKTKTRDWILIGVIVLVPLLFIGMGFVSETNSRAEAEKLGLANLVLGPNQYTDGRIVLTVPDGAECEEEMEDGLKIFTVSFPDSNTTVSVVSDYDDDATKKNFEDCWKIWKNESIDDNLDYKVIANNTQTVGSFTIFSKLCRFDFDDDVPVDWEFALVFDKATGKFCLLSCYSDATGDTPMSYLINNLRFL